MHAIYSMSFHEVRTGIFATPCLYFEKKARNILFSSLFIRSSFLPPRIEMRPRLVATPIPTPHLKVSAAHLIQLVRPVLGQSPVVSTGPGPSGGHFPG